MAVLKFKDILGRTIYLPMENIVYAKVESKSRTLWLVISATDSYAEGGSKPHELALGLNPRPNAEVLEKIAELITYHRQYMAKNAKIIDIEKIIQDAKNLLDAEKQKACKRQILIF